ncbi:MAG: alpha amylase C-terminal domain-containing protein, partial [Desulfofustis sp.]
EFGQRSEWYCKQSLDWHLLDYGSYHRQTQEFVRQLNRFYKSRSPLWQLDYEESGFDWLDIDDQSNSIISFARRASEPGDHLVCLLNFTPQTINDYRIGLPERCPYTLVFNSDVSDFGGSGAAVPTLLHPIQERYARAPNHGITSVPPLAGIIFQPKQDEK